MIVVNHKTFEVPDWNVNHCKIENHVSSVNHQSSESQSADVN